MSTRSSTSITCPQCDHRQDFEIWPSLNVDLDPEQKDRLLSGELMRSICGECGVGAEVNYAILYHDMTRQLMVNFTGGDEKDELSNPLSERMLTDYQLRIVATRNALVEKVWISTASLDDRVMELFKLTMEQQMNQEDEEELLFAGIEEAENGERNLRFVRVNASGSESYDVPMGSFQDFSDTVSSSFGLGAPELGEWLTIDRQFAIKMFRDHFSEDSKS